MFQSERHQNSQNSQLRAFRSEERAVGGSRAAELGGGNEGLHRRRQSGRDTHFDEVDTGGQSDARYDICVA